LQAELLYHVHHVVVLSEKPFKGAVARLLLDVKFEQGDEV
jgi:hypothetical protein